MARSAAGVWRAVACTSLLGMTLAQNYCAPDTCETETPTIYYNCPTPTIALSTAPTSSPVRETSAPAPTSSPVVTVAPTGPSKAPIKSPSMAPTAPTVEDLAPTEDLLPSMAPATKAPTASPVPTKEPTKQPSESPRTCECQVKRGVFNMAMPTYTCPTPAPVINLVISSDLGALSLNPDIAAALAKPVKGVTEEDVLSVLADALPVGVVKSIVGVAGLPALVLQLTAAPTLTSSGAGSSVAVAVALEILIDFTTLLANPADYKASLKLWFATLFDVNPSQVNSIKITAGAQSYKRKAGALSTTPVTITSSICSAANCASAASFQAFEVPLAAATVWAAAGALDQQTVTLQQVQSVLTVGTNIDVDANDLKMHLTVMSLPTMTTAGTISDVSAYANTVSFIYRANVNWADVELRGKGMSKAAYIYATALTFSPPLNVNQFKNVMFLPPGEATYGRRAGGLARTIGQISQDIIQPGTVIGTPVTGGTLSVEDDDSSIIAVAVIVPITVIAIVLVIVWYLVCGGDDEKKEVTNPYGNREEVVNPDNVDGEVPEGEAAP